MEELTFGKWLLATCGWAVLVFLILAFVVSFVMCFYSIYYQKNKRKRELQERLNSKAAHIQRLKTQAEQHLKQARANNDEEAIRKARAILRVAHNFELLQNGKEIKR